MKNKSNTMHVHSEYTLIHLHGIRNVFTFPFIIYWQIYPQKMLGKGDWDTSFMWLSSYEVFSTCKIKLFKTHCHVQNHS